MSVKSVTPQILNAIGPYLSSGDKIRIKNEVNARKNRKKEKEWEGLKKKSNKK